MTPVQSRLIALIDSVVPQPHGLTLCADDVELTQLGFDSMALVSLFVELESEFDLSIQELSRCLHKRCSLHALLALCGDDARGAAA